ncbi:kinase [Thraustotheca clavata]|uniref:non-specific serine/threonine protein kinase n=1 Tax=Thraustotheca clavata TaxID=74557 RepID=A0A1V9Z6N7_9STRA|nr:kinase [Thraustotheca clavata]
MEAPMLTRLKTWWKKSSRKKKKTQEASVAVALDIPKLQIPMKKREFHEFYTIVKDLGNGSYSQVKQVTHKIHGGCYAAKIINKIVLSKVDRQALSQEVQVLKKMNHQYIMKLYEVFEDESTCYMVLEYLDGGDLFDRITKRGNINEREAQRIIAALVEAVYYCHAHCVVHRDIKPENIMLSGRNIKLCDFGFARQLTSTEELASDSCGTPGYAAPEVLNGHPYGCEVDIFSLGVVLYILLCGYPPFPMKLHKLRKHSFDVIFPSKEWYNVAEDIKDLIRSMLSVVPADRPTALSLMQHPWIQAGIMQLPPHRVPDQRSQLFGAGTRAVKYGRQGFPHNTVVQVCTACKLILWTPKSSFKDPTTQNKPRAFSVLSLSTSKSSSQTIKCSHNQPSLSLQNVTRIVQGSMTQVFDRVVQPRSENCCSIVTNDRTLDLEFPSKQICEEMLVLFTEATINAKSHQVDTRTSPMKP